MSKIINSKDHPEEHEKLIGFVQKFKQEDETKVRSHFLSKEALTKLTGHEDFGGIRIHYGRNDEGRRHMILEAVDNQKQTLDSFAGGLPTCPDYC